MTEDELNLLRLVTYVKISSYRKRTLKTLENNAIKIPTEIAKESGIRTNHISKVLRELKDHGLVVCLNPDFRKGRLYQLTPLGTKVAGRLE